MPYKDPEMRRSYARQWIAARRKDWIEANGPCRYCGGSVDLQVDHVEPELKATNAGSLWSYHKEARVVELAKCQVLCKSCHQGKTISFRLKPIIHGTVRAYWRKCRCDQCCAANSAQRRLERLKKAGATTSAAMPQPSVRDERRGNRGN